MRVVIDAVPLLVRSAGVKSYFYHWIRELRRAAGPRQIGTFPPMPELGRLWHEGSVAPRWRTAFGLTALALANRTPLPVIEWLTRGASIFHASTLTHRPPRRPRLSATVFDLTCWIMPELHTPANLEAERGFGEVLRRADRLITISESTRRDAARVLKIPDGKIVTIYPGVAESYFQVDAAAIAGVRERYKLTRPYVLFVSTIEPRKNVDTLLDAFAALPESLRDEFELVVAGPAGWAPAATFARLASAHYLGYVPEQDLAPLTAAATVFAYPSLYEGFGFPLAQAMAAGVPAITSNVSSMPEITGDAALLIDPRSQSELRGALARLLLSPELRADLSARGRFRAGQYRWSSCAAQSLRYFEELDGAG